MEQLTDKVLMITPFDKSQRGNSLTTARLQVGLTGRGFHIDRISLEDTNWQEQLQYAAADSKYAMVHGFHALHFGQVLQVIPEILKLPLILTATGTDLHYDLLGTKQTVVLNTMQAVQKIVVFNDDFHSNLQASYPEFSDKLVTIPQGIFLETGTVKTRKELGLSPDDIVFLLPSGLRAVKNIELAIDSLEIVHREYPRLRLLIIGTAIEEHYSRRIINRIHKLSWITYLGEIPHADMKSILALGDVVINTSHYEGQPQGVLEAMSLGKPCILTAVPGNLNLIKTGIEGIYVDGEAELISASKMLINDPVQRKKMGQNACKLAETSFSLKHELDAYSRIYNLFLKQ